MKNSALLITILLFVFSKICWGDGNSQANDFSEYINAPGNAGDNSDNNMPFPPMTGAKIRRDSERSDSGDSGAKSLLQGIPPKWKACLIDSDCTAAVADCASWDALNKKYLNRLSKNLKSCSESIDPGFQPVTVCVQKFCQATDKTTLVSWDEWLERKNESQAP
jgi:hypothetical protein